MTDTATTERIALEDIEVTGRNPRTHFDEESLESLTRSIDAKGLLQPILVRPLEENGDGPRFELVSGERRLRAHRRLDRETIRCEVRDLTAEEAAELRLVENIEREDLHPLEEASAYDELLASGWTVEGVAEKVGRTERYVYSRRKLQDLVPEARAAFLEDGRIVLGHAQLLARLDENEQKKALRSVTHYVVGFKSGQERSSPLSVAGLRAWIDDHLHLELQQAPFSMDDADLYPEMGACRDCPFRSGSHPELFEDVETETVCTKPACYAEKVERTILEKSESLRAEGVDPVIGCATGYSYRREDGDEERFGVDRIMALGSYQSPIARVQDDPCGHEFRAVMVAGPDRGEYVTVCLDEGCETHHGTATTTRREPDPFDVWRRGFRSERRSWRRTLNRLRGARAAKLALDLGEDEVLRCVVLRLFTASFTDRMNAVARLIGWPETPRGYMSDDEAAVEYREEIWNRLQAAGRDELYCVLWALAFQRQLDGGGDVFERLTPWGGYSATSLLSAEGVAPAQVRDDTTKARIGDGETLLPEYRDTVVVVDEGDETELGHLLAEGADACRCGLEPDGERLGPGDGELDDVTIHEECLRAFFEDEVESS